VLKQLCKTICRVVLHFVVIEIQAQNNSLLVWKSAHGMVFILLFIFTIKLLKK
jgi:hypothetical protein